MLLSRFSSQVRLRRFAYVLLFLLLCVQGACSGNTEAGYDPSVGTTSDASHGRRPPCPDQTPDPAPSPDDPGPTPDPSPDPNTRPRPTPGQAGGVVQEQLALINDDRASLGLAPLSL
ncbi:MAG TPA: hypothetical protein VFH51_05845, partial [Myxococcota bacterium]|nr:hypothetical protein [Myxococcota bacterium]